jgi:uncharacterized protein YndB with AHSA1/START domain
METYSIQHQVGIKAAASAVYEALTDSAKLAGWWTSDTRGNGAVPGGVLEFWFGDFYQMFEVVELQPDQRVRWKAIGNKSMDEWDGTEVAFSLSSDGKQTYVNFSHAGWRRDNGFLPHCSTKWAVFMLSLKDLLEKGKGQPAPDDVQINHD